MKKKNASKTNKLTTSPELKTKKRFSMNKKLKINIKKYGLLFIIVFLILVLGTGNIREIEKYLGLIEEWVDYEIANQTYQKVEEVRIVMIVDGDTAKLEDGRTIRYLNIDTPETKKPGTPIECYGQEASSYNKSIVEGRKVFIEYDVQKKDKYNRDLVFVYLNLEDTKDINKSLNAAMVRNGLARALIIKPNNSHERNFRRLEYEAKKSQRGLWSKCN